MARRTVDTVLLLGGAAGCLYAAGTLLGRRRARMARPAAASAAVAEPGAAGPTEPSPGRPAGETGVSRRFDRLFAEFGRGLPVPYLRALAQRESSMNPGETVDPAWGLLQVIEVVRTDYNSRHGTRHTRRDLLEPVINIQVATDTLRRIIESYRRHHPTVPNLHEDWNNLRFVELLTFGWNAGYSEKAGVGKVVSFLEAAGKRDITIDTVHEWAKGTFGASKHLLRSDKVAWSKSVAALYAKERERDEREVGSAVAMRVALNGPGEQRNAWTPYRPVGTRGEPYPDWVRRLKGSSGVYVIRRDGEVVYVGSSSAGRLYETLTRHLQGWRRSKGFWSGQFSEGHDPGLTYDRGSVEVAVKVTPASRALDEEARLIRRLRPRDNLIGQPAEVEEVPF